MDYEKKYKDAIEKARKLCAYPITKPFISDLQDIFPELKESEDDEVRKKLIHLVKKSYEQGGYALHEWEADEMLAWLEKQGDIPAGAVLDSNEDGLIADTIRYKREKQGEQKPADIIPQDFEKYVEHLLSLSDGEGHGSPAKVKEVSAELFRLAKLEQKPAWSEEDEMMIKFALTYFRKAGATEDSDIIKWLKSLRPRNRWKPSEEQIGLLQAIVNAPNNASSESCQIVLKEVIKQLKKLKE